MIRWLRRSGTVLFTMVALATLSLSARADELLDSCNADAADFLSEPRPSDDFSPRRHDHAPTHRR